MWWIMDIEGAKHAVEVQHGLRGGYRAVLFDGEMVEEYRPVRGMLWDSGSCHEFQRLKHTFKVSIVLEGQFFSSSMQFYSYTLEVDGLSILQHKVELQDDPGKEDAEKCEVEACSA